VDPWPAVPERFWTSFRDAPLGAALLDADGVVWAANPALGRLLGYGADELTGVGLAELAHPMDRVRDQRRVAEAAGGAGESADQTRLVHKSGRLSTVQLSIFRLGDRSGATEWLLAVVEDRSGQRTAEDTLHRLSTTDELTGLFNRRGFQLLAELQWRIARRTHRHLLLLYLDVDGLKRVNDELGHAVGDDLLVEAAEVLRGICRDSDVVARVGGDEFVVLAVEAEAASFAIFRQRLARAIRERSGRPGRRYPLSMSVGAAHYGPEAPHTIEEMLAEADARMYDEKRGRSSAPAAPAAPRIAADGAQAPSVVAACGRGPEEELTAALEEVAALALANASYEERLVRIHRRAVTALTRRGSGGEGWSGGGRPAFPDRRGGYP
jgi:diguanylate cyclase (GGDEF)-like protein/PAS domain S-box-containing protein